MQCCKTFLYDLVLSYIDFMMSLSDDKQADVIDAFNNTSRCLDDTSNLLIFILTLW